MLSCDSSCFGFPFNFFCVKNIFFDINVLQHAVADTEGIMGGGVQTHVSSIEQLAFVSILFHFHG